MEETSSPVVPLDQIGLVFCFQIFTKSHGILESVQLEEVNAKRDSTVSRVIRVGVAKCLQSVGAARRRGSTRAVAIVWFGIATSVFRIATVGSQLAVTAADL